MPFNNKKIDSCLFFIVLIACFFFVLLSAVVHMPKELWMHSLFTRLLSKWMAKNSEYSILLIEMWQHFCAISLICINTTLRCVRGEMLSFRRIFYLFFDWIILDKKRIKCFIWNWTHFWVIWKLDEFFVWNRSFLMNWIKSFYLNRSFHVNRNVFCEFSSEIVIFDSSSTVDQLAVHYAISFKVSVQTVGDTNAAKC